MQETGQKPTTPEGGWRMLDLPPSSNDVRSAARALCAAMSGEDPDTIVLRAQPARVPTPNGLVGKVDPALSGPLWAEYAALAQTLIALGWTPPPRAAGT